MVTFELFLNGQRVCTAGLEDPGVLTAIMTFVTANRDQPELDLRVGGMEKLPLD